MTKKRSSEILADENLEIKAAPKFFFGNRGKSEIGWENASLPQWG